MAILQRFLLASVFVSCLVATCYGGVSFKSLHPTLTVTATHKEGVLKAGLDNITVTWALDPSAPAGTDASYKTIKVKLCYAPVSQVDRGWRKTKDDLTKDKTGNGDPDRRAFSGSREAPAMEVQRQRIDSSEQSENRCLLGCARLAFQPWFAARFVHIQAYFAAGVVHVIAAGELRRLGGRS
ncbi:hypothetical protein ABFX02_09G013600 [Erythranthe guttata]